MQIRVTCAKLKVKCAGNSLSDVRSDINFNRNREKYSFRTYLKISYR